MIDSGQPLGHAVVVGVLRLRRELEETPRGRCEEAPRASSDASRSAVRARTRSSSSSLAWRSATWAARRRASARCRVRAVHQTMTENTTVFEVAMSARPNSRP